MRLHAPEHINTKKWIIQVSNKTPSKYLEPTGKLDSHDIHNPDKTYHETEELAWRASDAYYYKHKLYNCMRRFKTLDSDFISKDATCVVAGISSRITYKLVTLQEADTKRSNFYIFEHDNCQEIK